MLINGSWFVCQDDTLRPVIHAKVLAANGSWQPAPFLVDTGADRTLLSGNVWLSLGMPADKPAYELSGLGGSSESVFADTKLQFRREDGTDVVVRGPFVVFTTPDTLDMSLLGRDVLNLFALIVDRPRDVVYLLGLRHHYKIDHH
jgi:hypothetical protein